MKRGSLAMTIIALTIALGMVAMMPTTGLAAGKTTGRSATHSRAASWPQCFNYGCDNQWPNDQGCDLWSGEVDTAYETWGEAELWWSSSCAANWARSVSYQGYLYMMARTERDNGDAVEAVDVAYELQSPMLGGVANFNRACGGYSNWGDPNWWTSCTGSH